MANHEIVQETVNFNGERVDYQDWLKDPVFETFWWSPAGVHVEALVQIGRGKDVSWAVINTLYKVDPDRALLSIISGWNGLGRRQRDVNEATVMETIMSIIIDKYQDDPVKNAHFSQCNPAHIDDAKKYILNLGVGLRSGALKD